LPGKQGGSHVQVMKKKEKEKRVNNESLEGDPGPERQEQLNLAKTALLDRGELRLRVNSEPPEGEGKAHAKAIWELQVWGRGGDLKIGHHRDSSGKRKKIGFPTRPKGGKRREKGMGQNNGKKAAPRARQRYFASKEAKGP